MKKTIPFKYKLIISILVMSIVPLVINSIYSLKSSRDELSQAAFDKLISVRELKNKSLSRYLNSISSNIIVLSHNKMLIQASKDFISAFKKVPAPDNDASTKLKEYYDVSFAQEYKNKTGNDSPLGEIVKTLPQESLTLQHAFISDNKNPLGSKHLLDESPLVPEYSALHKTYHPVLREYLETFALYDIFIVDIETGNLVYTVYKELDFATNLLTGPYKDTNFADVFRQAREINDPKEFKIVDFKRYTPSYEAPASFIAAPIWEGDKKIAVLIFQMPLGVINDIMGERAGLGNSGEAYLVGEDKRLRSDTHNDKDFNIYNSFNKEKLIENSHIKEALEGKEGSEVTKNYKGNEVLSAFTKIEFPHLSWVIFAEQSTTESFAAINKIVRNVIIFILILVVVVILVSIYITNTLSKQIEEIVEAFSNSAHDVQNSSQKMDMISNKLYKSVQTQISSITESAAAMDEISAMLKNNTGSSQKAATLSQHSKSSALKGKATVDKMIEEVNEISKSYDEIQKSVEQNNQDINRIIQVITEIADKTKVINDIVFQTKLLSFNASVEAARAGESGKGFAVVAEEIANLAAMSGKASNDISVMLTDSQEQVRTIAEETKKHIEIIVKNGRKKVEAGTEVASQCIGELDLIIECVNEMDLSIQEITAAISEQSTGVDEVNSAMKYLENATHETTDTSERSKASSEELKKQAIALRVSIQSLRKILGAKKSYDPEDVIA